MTTNETSRDPLAGRAPDFQLTLTRALLETLELDRILYVILSGITAGDGLGYNRAFLLLADEGGRVLRGQLAIGPESQAEASRIWESMEAERFDLDRVMHRYEEFRADPLASRMVRLVQQISLPLPLEPGADTLLGLLGRVLKEKRPLAVNGLEVPFTPTPLALGNFALAPLLAAERGLGAIVVDNRWNGQPIPEDALGELQSLANLAAVAVERARLHERIRRMAELDGLTTLLNRRRFDEAFPAAFEECRVRSEPLSVLLVDVDHFKAINDLHGHLAGDDLLRGLARIVRERVRRGDLAARYGGDELVLVLPHAAGPEALRLASELASTVRGTDFAEGTDHGRLLRATVSVGVAELHDGCPTPTHLLGEADRALYRAKQAGRDHVELWTKQD